MPPSKSLVENSLLYPLMTISLSMNILLLFDFCSTKHVPPSLQQKENSLTVLFSSPLLIPPRGRRSVLLQGWGWALCPTHYRDPPTRFGGERQIGLKGCKGRECV